MCATHHRISSLLLTLAVRFLAVHGSYRCDEFTAAEVDKWLSLHHTYDNRSAMQPVLRPILEAREHPSRNAHSTDQKCNADSLTGTGSLNGQWFGMSDPEQHVVFEPHACQLRRLSAAAARQCLDGKYVMFIGDSLTRHEGSACGGPQFAHVFHSTQVPVPELCLLFVTHAAPTSLSWFG